MYFSICMSSYACAEVTLLTMSLHCNKTHGVTFSLCQPDTCNSPVNTRTIVAANELSNAPPHIVIA